METESSGDVLVSCGVSGALWSFETESRETMSELQGHALWNETAPLKCVSQSQKLGNDTPGKFSSGGKAAKETDLLDLQSEGCSTKSCLKIPGPARSSKRKDEIQGIDTSHQFWEETPPTFYQQAF